MAGWQRTKPIFDFCAGGGELGSELEALSDAFKLFAA